MGSWRRRTQDDEETSEETVQVSAAMIAAAAKAGGSAGTESPPAESEADMGHATLAMPVMAHHDEQLQRDRNSLVQLCLYAFDQARSSGVAERIEQGLAEVGVVAVRPDGQRFNPALHEAGGTVSTTDSALDGLVAETEVVGFTDRGQLLRAPVVTVYTTK